MKRPLVLVIFTTLLVIFSVSFADVTSCPPGSDTPEDEGVISTPPVIQPDNQTTTPPAPISNFPTRPDTVLSRPTANEQEMREIYKFRYQTGVNFGGPFVLERWMNFGVFSGLPESVGTSQDAFNRGVGDVEKLKQRLQDLWTNYIQECDYQLAASWGINTIRLPVGYWIIGGKYPDVPMLPPFDRFTAAYANAENEVHKVFQTAAKYGLGVLLDLHGAPGSQNGADHSGVSGPTALYGNAQNREVTVATLRRFAQIYGNYTNLVGIELLNEPRDDAQLVNIYRDAYNAIRRVDATIPVYICDTVWSSNWNKWIDFIVNNNWELAWLDVHKYYCFAGGGTPADSYINGIRLWERDQMASVHNRVPVVVGEWSNAFNPGSYNGYDQQRRDGSRRNFGAQQLETWKRGGGFHFWTWRGDWADGSDWDFKSLNLQGWYTANYYPFPTLRCAEKRQKAASAAVDQVEVERSAGLSSHQAYWRRTNPSGTYDWEKYNIGFVDGYTAALRFFYSADSKISHAREMANYKSKIYASALLAQNLPLSNVWQYRDGFQEGVGRFYNVLDRVGA